LINRSYFKRNAWRIALLAVLVAGVAGFFILGGHDALTFNRLVENKDALIGLADRHPLLASAAFVGAYLLLGLFGLPGSTMLNIAAGALFAFWKGLFLVIAGSTLASSLAFFAFRFLFRGYVEAKVRTRFPRLEEDLEREGAYFVFAMRLFPVIPFSLTNLVLAISPVRFFTYLVVSLVALLPRYLLYVYTGDNLGNVRNPDDLVSPSLLGALAILAVLPWALKWASPRIKSLFVKKHLE
jgi:uncharacterized membrane protein YdjX (TVP38/TMEM64 family)